MLCLSERDMDGNADFVVTSAQLPLRAFPDHEWEGQPGTDFTVDHVLLQFATLHFKPGHVPADFTTFGCSQRITLGIT